MDSEWTYGAEHELSDWPRSRALPEGWGIDLRDVSMVNSDGRAVDPKGRRTAHGGEALAPPTSSPAGQGERLAEFLARFPEATVNHRSNLHIHVRVPGLREDLGMLKRLQAFNGRELSVALALVEPIPRPVAREYPTEEEFEGALRRYRRRLRSHHTTLPASRIAAQLAAWTVEEFFAAEVPRSRAGKPMWHAQPRAAVNLRQLRETDTIEFRHFPGTLSPLEVTDCAEWCRRYLLDAFGAQRGAAAIHAERAWAFPAFPAYVHRLEVGYWATK